jgi:hypothetical protein
MATAKGSSVNIFCGSVTTRRDLLTGVVAVSTAVTGTMAAGVLIAVRP